MKYYSESLRKLFDSEKELIAAETKLKEAEIAKLKAEEAKKAERAARAKEVEKAIKEANEAQAKAIKLLKNFTADYGAFHMSYSTDGANEVQKKTANSIDFFDLLSSFLK